MKPKKILLLIGFALLIIWMFFLISCNSDKGYYTKHDTTYATTPVHSDTSFVIPVYDTVYIRDTIYIK